MDDDYENIPLPLRPWAASNHPGKQHIRRQSAATVHLANQPPPPGSPFQQKQTQRRTQHHTSQSVSFINVPPRTPTTPLPPHYPPSSSLAALDATKHLMSPLASTSSATTTTTTTTTAAMMAASSISVPSLVKQTTRMDLTSEDKWRRLGARILPLFNGDRVQGTVEEINEMVRGCLRSSDNDAAWSEISSILKVGMSTLVHSLHKQLGVSPRLADNNSKGAVQLLSMSAIVNADNNVVSPDRLIAGVSSVWQTMYSHVLPYLEGVLLPLKQFRIAAGRANTPGGGVRRATLMYFRDILIMPLLDKLDDAARLAQEHGLFNPNSEGDHHANLAAIAQMLAVLATIRHSVDEDMRVRMSARTFTTSFIA